MQGIPSSQPLLLLAFVGGLSTFLLHRYLFSNSSISARLLPPGPPGLPIIGNALQIPRDRQWLKWDEWRKQYGDVMRITVLGQPAIILSSLKAANDLLETRGNIYSDRPPAIMAGELVGWNRGLGYSQASHNPRFREFRRLFHQFIGPRACADPSLIELQEQENQSLIRKLAEDPLQFAGHARDVTSSTILLLSYGYSSHSGDPLQLVKIAEDAMAGFAKASEPGTWWVDSFPALRYIPSWFPGATFHSAAATMREDLRKLYDVPFQFVKEHMNNIDTKPSFVSRYLEEKHGVATSEEEELIKAAAASFVPSTGGAETTPSAITSFILAMTLYPEVQKRAQKEIDSLLSSSSARPSESRMDPASARRPGLSDRDKLPYVSALVKEVWRWNPSVPLGLPHVASQDDIYEGFHIEKGSTVWANIWSILHNEAMFPNPGEFRPERYLDEHGKLENNEASEAVGVAFGFGRRICPGMYLAENSVFIAIASILAVFEISRAIDGTTGEEIVPEVEYDGFISHPRPFRCRILRRGALQ